MKRFGTKARAVLLSLLVMSVSAVAAPSPGIRSLIATPASAFDVFLHQVYLASNGASFFGGPNMREQLRMFDMQYDYSTNLITMRFHINPDHKSMNGFSGSSLEGKKDIMLRAAKNLAQALGVEPLFEEHYMGVIQSLKIRNGWTSKDFDEEKVKAEIVSRTVMDLVFAWEEKTIYQVRRSHTGRYEFSMDTKSVKF